VITLGTPHRGAPAADPATWMYNGLTFFLLHTDGVKDLRPNSPFIAQLDQLTPDQEARFSSFRGTVDLSGFSPAGHLTLRPIQDVYALNVFLGQNDGLVLST
jgi:hypothetical protein